jgi:hypothetical protein
MRCRAPSARLESVIQHVARPHAPNSPPHPSFSPTDSRRVFLPGASRDSKAKAALHSPWSAVDRLGPHSTPHNEKVLSAPNVHRPSGGEPMLSLFASRLGKAPRIRRPPGARTGAGLWLASGVARDRRQPADGQDMPEPRSELGELEARPPGIAPLVAAVLRGSMAKPRRRMTEENRTSDGSVGTDTASPTKNVTVALPRWPLESLA